MITKHQILSNALTRALYGRFLHFLDGQNIERRLQDIALDESARYVTENMPNVPSFVNDFDLLKHALNHVNQDLQGLYCEFGVWRGTTINHIAKIITKHTVWGFDSFEGLPERWRDGFDKGRFKVASLPKVEANVNLVKGWFDETLPKFLEDKTGSARFLHIDCDLYSSTKTIFSLFKDRIVPGTVIVFDEFFNYPGWNEGERKALDEFIAETGYQYEWIGYCKFHEQAALIIR